MEVTFYAEVEYGDGNDYIEIEVVADVMINKDFDCPETDGRSGPTFEVYINKLTLDGGKIELTTLSPADQRKLYQLAEDKTIEEYL